MPITSGFFNSKNGDRVYDAMQMGSLFGGIIKDGVFANYPNTGNQFRVIPVAGELAVYVCPGRGWFHNTWINNDSNVKYTLAAAANLTDRIDSLFIKVDLSNDGRKSTIELRTGTPAATPAAPTKPADTALIFWYRLADVTVKANATTIASQTQIREYVGDGKPIPYITGPLETIDSDQVLSRWNADWATLLRNINTDWAVFKADAEDQIDETTQSYLNTVPNPIQQYVYSQVLPTINRLTEYDHMAKFFLFLHGRRTDYTSVDPYVTSLPRYNQTATYDGASLSWQKWGTAVLPQEKDIFMDKLGRFAEVTEVNYEPDENDNPYVESLSVKTFYDPSKEGHPNVYFLEGSKLNDVGQAKTYGTRQPPSFRGVYSETLIKNNDIVIDDDGRCAVASDIVIDENYFISGTFTTFTDLRPPRVFYYDEPYNDLYGFGNELPAKGDTRSVDADVNWLAVEGVGIHPEDSSYKLRVNDILVGASGKAARITAVRNEQGFGSVFDVIGIGTVPMVAKAAPLIVNFTGSDACSHTYAQIMVAINAGRSVQFYWSSGEANASSYALPNFDYNSSGIEANGFDVQSIDGGTLGNFLWYHIHCRIDSNNNVECEYTESGQ